MADRTYIPDHPEYFSSIERWKRIDAFITLWQHTSAYARNQQYNPDVGIEDFIALPELTTVDVSQRAVQARPSVVEEFAERGIVSFVPGIPRLTIEITFPFPDLFQNEVLSVDPFDKGLHFDQLQLSEIGIWASERPTNAIVLG